MKITEVITTLQQARNEATEQLRRINQAIESLSGEQAITGKKTMSPAARKRIAEAQKARWAKFHAAKKRKLKLVA